MKVTRLFVGLCMSISTCWAVNLQDNIQKLLAKPTPLHGKFRQVKSVQGFNTPMRSSGSFILVPDKGLIWATEKPFNNEIRITPTKLVQCNDGVTTLTLETQQQPALRVMNQVMFRLLAGDIHALDADFFIQGTIDHRVWQVILRPKNPALSHVLKYISLTGSGYVAAMKIEEANGDKTRVDLIEQKPYTLTTAENKRFE